MNNTKAVIQARFEPTMRLQLTQLDEWRVFHLVEWLLLRQWLRVHFWGWKPWKTEFLLITFIADLIGQIKGDDLLGSREVITNLSLPSETVRATFHRTRLLDVQHVCHY